MSRRSLALFTALLVLAVGVAWFVARPNPRADAVVPSARDLELASARELADPELIAPVARESEASSPAERTAAHVDPATPVARAQYLVNGRVVDDRGVPVRSFVVRIDPAGEDDGRRYALDRFQGKSGEFSLRYATDGEWTVHALSDDGLNSPAQIVRFPDDATKRLELVLARSASVEGVVYGPDGSPAAGVRVEAVGAKGFDLRVHRSTTTGENGAFVLERLPAQAIEIRARADGGLSGFTEVGALPAERTKSIVVALRRGGAIEGRLVDAASAPRAQVPVWLWNEGGASRSQTTTDAHGGFRFGELVPGDYVVLAPQPGGADGALERKATVDHERVTVVDLGVGAPPRIRVRGTVRTSAPAGGAVVVFERASGMRGGPDYGEASTLERTRAAARAPVAAAATANAAGAYEIGLRERGVYAVRVLWRGATIHARGVVIGEEPQQTVDLAFGSSSIAGRVLASDGSPTPSTIRVEAAGCDSLSSTSTHVEFATDATGTFAIDGLDGGAYVVAAREPPVIDVFRSVAGNEHRTRVELARDEHRAGVEIRLGRPGSVRVLVLGLEGRPEADAHVSTNGLHTFNPAVTTDANGVVILEDVPPGDATIDVIAPAAALGAQAAVASARVVVAPDRTTEVTVRVVAAGRIEIRLDGERDASNMAAPYVVIDASGSEVARGSIGGSSRGSWRGVGADEATARGGVVTRPLAPGAYRVRAQVGERVVETTVRVEALKRVEAALSGAR